MSFIRRVAARFRHRREHHVATHDEVVGMMRRMRASKAKGDKFDPSPNRDYESPFDGGQTPGFRPGGPF